MGHELHELRDSMDAEAGSDQHPMEEWADMFEPYDEDWLEDDEEGKRWQTFK